MTIVIDPLTAVIFFAIGFLAGAAFTAIKVAAASARRTTVL